MCQSLSSDFRLNLCSFIIFCSFAVLMYIFYRIYNRYLRSILRSRTVLFQMQIFTIVVTPDLRIPFTLFRLIFSTTIRFSLTYRAQQNCGTNCQRLRWPLFPNRRPNLQEKSLMLFYEPATHLWCLGCCSCLQLSLLVCLLYWKNTNATNHNLMQSEKNHIFSVVLIGRSFKRFEPFLVLVFEPMFAIGATSLNPCTVLRKRFKFSKFRLNCLVRTFTTH